MATQEQINDFKAWLRRQRLAQRRVEAGRYGYTEIQAEEDGLSLASLDDEIGQLAHEHGFSLPDRDEWEHEVDEWEKTMRCLPVDNAGNWGHVGYKHSGRHPLNLTECNKRAAHLRRCVKAFGADPKGAEWQKDLDELEAHIKAVRARNKARRGIRRGIL